MNAMTIRSFPLVLLLVACSSETPGPAAATQPPSAAAQAFALDNDPGAAIGVVAAKQAGPADRVVVEGRVHEIQPGLGVFTLMDTKLEYCGQVNKEDKCDTPWDYCCDSRETRRANSLLVELRGADGAPLATPSLPELRLCDLAKVRGKLTADEHGNLTLIADGIYRADRPALPDYVKWPKVQ